MFPSTSDLKNSYGFSQFLPAAGACHTLSFCSHDNLYIRIWKAPPALSYLSAQAVFHYSLMVYTGYILLSTCNRFRGRAWENEKVYDT